MTKKFWNDWKGRIGETEQVYLCWKFNNDNRLRYSSDLLDLDVGDRILSTEFNKDTVKMKIERKNYVADYSTKGYHYNVQNEYVTIDRKDIVSVEFKKIS